MALESLGNKFVENVETVDTDDLSDQSSVVRL